MSAHLSTPHVLTAGSPRVRHGVRDRVAVMAFSAAASGALAFGLALLLAALGRQ